MCEDLFVCVGARDSRVASYWIDTLVLKNWGEILTLSWEKALVKPMAPGLFSIIQVSNLFYFAIFTFNLYHKNTKNIYLIIIISIRSHSCKWSWRDWQPLYRVGCEVLICLCRYEVTRAWSPTGLIPWFSKTEGNTYAALLHHPFLFKGKPT